MAYEFLDRAKTALDANDLATAVSEMFNMGEIDVMNVLTTAELRIWARGEADQGYGLRAQILNLVAGRRCGEANASVS